MADILRIKRRTSGAPGAPSGLANAELAYNEVDHVLYYGEGTGGTGGTATTVVPIGGAGNFLSLTAAAATYATIANDALKAPLASPSLTGNPTAPTPAQDDNDTSLATTAYVIGQAGALSPLMNGSVTAGTALRWSRQDHVHPTDTTRASLASPPLTGIPTAPTAAADTNTTQLATTAYVVGQAASATPLGSGTAAVGTSLRYARGDHVHPSDASRAPLASPPLTGVPTAPTPANGTNTTQLATTAFVLGTRLDQMAAPTVDVAWNSHKITGLADPTSAQDAATKNYVDLNLQGLQAKPTADLATAAALPAATYANGTSGVGATLTATATGVLTVDGVATTLGMGVLVKNQAAPAQNGLYSVTTAGAVGVAFVLTRDPTMDSSTEFAASFVPIAAGGTANANTLWLCNPVGAVTVGTTAIPFSQLGAATSLIGSSTVLLSGNALSVIGTANRISVTGGVDIAATYVGQSSITTLGTITTGVWNGSTVGVANGGSGATSLTGYLKGAGASAFTGVASIPSTDISGLGGMATQAASAVAITGGTIDNVTIDGGVF